MIQNIIIGYASSEDAISITILGKMKLEYSNKRIISTINIMS